MGEPLAAVEPVAGQASGSKKKAPVFVPGMSLDTAAIDSKTWDGCYFDNVKFKTGMCCFSKPLQLMVTRSKDITGEVYAHLWNGEANYAINTKTGFQPPKAGEKEYTIKGTKFTGGPEKLTFKFDTPDERNQFAEIMKKLCENNSELIEEIRRTGKRRMAEHEDSSLGQYQSDSSGLKSVCVLLFFVLMFAISVLILFRG